MSVLPEKSNEIKSWAVSILIHVLLLLIAVFFVTCWKEQIPAPDPGQGIELSFGTVSEVVGETEKPLTNGEQIEEVEAVEEVQPESAEESSEENIEQPVEEIVAEESLPLESEYLNPESNDSNEEVVEPDVLQDESSKEEQTSELDDPDKEEEKLEESVAALPGLPGVSTGGSGKENGQVGEKNNKSVSLSSGLGSAEIPKGWAMSTEPIPDIKKDGVVVISVEFNRNGDYVWNSARYVSGDHSIFSTYKNTKIEESLRKQLKLSTDGTIAPKIKNVATFRFEFKGR